MTNHSGYRSSSQCSGSAATKATPSANAERTAPRQSRRRNNSAFAARRTVPYKRRTRRVNYSVSVRASAITGPPHRRPRRAAWLAISVTAIQAAPAVEFPIPLCITVAK